MTDLQKDLVALFDTTATDADVPALPLQEVLTRGRSLQRVRRRRAAIWSAAAAAVAVVAVALPLALTTHGDGSPAPAHHTQTSRPSTSPVTLPYLDGRQLHAGGQTIPTDAKQILSKGGVTYVSTGGEGWTWSHLVDGQLKQVSDPAMSRERPWLGWHGADLSPDGSVLTVVTYPNQHATRLKAYDTSDDTKIARVDLPLPFTNWTGGGNSLTLLGTDASGQVYWEQEMPEGTKLTRSDWVWRPGYGAPTQLGEPFTSQPYGLFDVTPAGPLIDDYVVDANGDRRSARLPARAASGAVWAPSGATYARKTGTPAFVTTADGSSVAAKLPGILQRWIGYESATSVLGAVITDAAPELVRCDVASGDCATVEPLPDGSQRQWATNGPADPTPVAVDTSSSLGAAATAAPATPYVHGGTLYADGKTFEVGRLVNLVTAGDTVLVGHWGKHITWQVLRGGQLVPLPYGQDEVPVLDPSGDRAVVATNPSPQTSRITVYDAATDAEIAHIDLDLPATCCDGGSVQMLSMDADGTVRWVEERDGAPEMKWRPGSAPVEVGDYAG